MRLQLAIEQLVHLQIRNLAEAGRAGWLRTSSSRSSGAPRNRPFQGMCVRTESEIQHSYGA